MNKKRLFLTAATVIMAGAGVIAANAADNEIQTLPAKVPLGKASDIIPNYNNVKPKCNCQKENCKCGEIKKQPPSEFKGKHHPDFGPRPSKEEMEAKKAEFEKRLNLTDEQKKKIEANRKADQEKIKPVMKKLKENRDEIRELKHNNTLSDSEKTKKLNTLLKENKALKEKADKYRQENMKNFEAILTDEQKVEFAKIKQEQKAEFEKRQKEFKERHDSEGFAPGRPHKPGFKDEIKPQPVTEEVK